MTILSPTEGCRSLVQRGKIGDFAKYGKVYYGHALYGKSFEEAGIYQMRTVKMGEPSVGTKYHYKKKPIKMVFYKPSTEPCAELKAQWPKIYDIGAKWWALTPAERLVYHTNAVRLHMTGYNLFVRSYLLS
jgi:hypothetical protein